MNTFEPWHTLLPESAQQLIQVIGWADTVRLIQHFGGTTLPMPMGATCVGRAALDALSEVMGEDTIKKLADFYGGAPLYVPRCDLAMRRARDKAINEEFEQRIRNNEIATRVVFALAIKYKLTDRRIWKILKTIAPSESR